MRGIRRGEAFAGGAAVLLVISLFLDWFASLSAWQLFRLVDVVLALLALVVLGLVVLRLLGLLPDLPAPPGAIVAGAGAIALVIALAFLLESTVPGVGIFLALVSSAAVAYGGWEWSRTPAGPPSASGRASPPPPGSGAGAGGATGSATEAGGPPPRR